MKYSVVRQKDENINLDGIVFFAQRLEEMLGDYTIDLYKMPLLNTHGLASEYCEVSQKVNKGIISKYHRDNLFEEFKESLEKDVVLKENWGTENIARVTKTFGCNNQENIDNIVAYVDAILGNGRYMQWAINTILKYTSLPKEKKKIEAAIRCFLPELISNGYEPEYIFNVLRNTFFKRKIVTESSVKDFCSVFDMKSHIYNVYFSVSSVVSHFRTILENRLRVCYEDDGNYQYFNKDKNKIIIYFKDIIANCPDMAAKLAYARLDLLFSFCKFVGDKKGISIQNKSMVIENGTQPVFVYWGRQELKIKENVNYKEIGMRSDYLITGLLNNAESEYFVLSKAIKLHNTAIAVSDVKSSFLSLWSALEVLSSGNDVNGKLQPVLDMVIPILQKNYFVSQIIEINKAFKDNLPNDAYKKLLEEISVVGCEKKKMFNLVFMENYEELRKEIMKQLKDFPVIRTRLSFLASLNSTKKIKVIMDAYVQRIRWHLYRIYRTRNIIVHSGEEPLKLEYLGEHLHSYLDDTAHEFVGKLSGEIPFKDRNNILVDLKFAIERINECLSVDREIDEEIINTLIHPEIGHIMKCAEHI